MPRRIGSTLVPRNPVARELATHRGGVHAPNRTSERRQDRNRLNQQLENWRDDLEFERQLEQETREL